MPKRKVPIVNKEFYHVINKGSFSQNIFFNKKDYRRALNTFFYYQNNDISVKYSHFLTQSRKEKERILAKLRFKKDFLVEIIAYCLMPNHFHFLLKQKIENGISTFITNFSSSYAHYFNSRRNRRGSLFEGRFKAVRIETEEQLLHVGRYIHLNPYSSYVVKNFNQLEAYQFSSLPEYLQKVNLNVCNKQVILSFFKNVNQYKNFVFDQADYQRKLDYIKHLALEN